DLSVQEKTAQRIVTIDDGLPGRGEPGQVELAIEDREQLLVIGIVIGRQEHVMQHALLHRGEGADVLDVCAGQVAGNCRHVLQLNRLSSSSAAMPVKLGASSSTSPEPLFPAAGARSSSGARAAGVGAWNSDSSSSR